MQRADSLEKDSDAGKDWRWEVKGGQGTGWFDGITDSMGMCLCKPRDTVKDKEAWHAAVHGIAESDMTGLVKNSTSRVQSLSLLSCLSGFSCSLSLLTCPLVPKPNYESSTLGSAHWLCMLTINAVSDLWKNILLLFHHGSDGKVPAYNAGDRGSIPALGRSPGEGNSTQSSILAWKIPWTEEPGRLQSMGSQKVGHDWATSLSLFTFIMSLWLWIM